MLEPDLYRPFFYYDSVVVQIAIAVVVTSLRVGQADPGTLGSMLRAATDRRDLQLRCVLPNEPVPERQADDGRVHRVVTRAGAPLAVLTCLDTTPDTVRLLVEVVERAGLAVEIGRLRAQSHRQLQEVKGIPGPYRVRRLRRRA